MSKTNAHKGSNIRSSTDINAIVKLGMEVNAWFERKNTKKHTMLAKYKIGKVTCSGILHVSQFPSQKRAERDAMFEVAKAPSGMFKLKVIEVLPPDGKRKFTFVRLTAREDFDPEIFRRSRLSGK